MKKTCLFALLIITSFVYYACHKQIEEYYLTSEEKAMIPFHGNEVVHFSSQSNEIEVLLADDRIDEIKRYNNDHTEKNYILVENSYINFSNEKYRLRLFMSSYPFPPTGVSFNFSFTDSKNYFGSFFKTINQEDSTQFLDSLLVNGSWIYDVFYDTMEYFHFEPPQDTLLVFPVKSFYSRQFGVIKIDFSDNTFWELDHIEWN